MVTQPICFEKLLTEKFINLYSPKVTFIGQLQVNNVTVDFLRAVLKF